MWQLDRVDCQLIDKVAWFMKLQSSKSKTGAAYSRVGQAWLGTSIGVTRETICHHVGKLRRLGVISVTRRRQRLGLWQTNLMVIQNWRNWWWHKTKGVLLRVSSRVKDASHKVLPKKETDNNSSGRPDPEQGLASLREIIIAFQAKKPVGR